MYFRLGKFEVFDGDPGDKISLKLTGEHARLVLFIDNFWLLIIRT